MLAAAVVVAAVLCWCLSAAVGRTAAVGFVVVFGLLLWPYSTLSTTTALASLVVLSLLACCVVAEQLREAGKRLDDEYQRSTSLEGEVGRLTQELADQVARCERLDETVEDLRDKADGLDLERKR